MSLAATTDLGTVPQPDARRSTRVAVVAAILALCSATVGKGSDGGDRKPTPSSGQAEAARRILDAKCLRCHDAKVSKGGLDLSTTDAILAGGEGGAVVAPGKPEESPLFEAVRDGTMPADGKGRLNPAEIETIRAWIEGEELAEASANAAAKGANGPAEVSQHDVLPILLRRCVVCHGRNAREGGLDLRTRASMLKGGESGPALIPGEPAKSLILEKIQSGAMPPLRRVVEVSIKPIEPSETDALRRWIARGAPDDSSQSRMDIVGKGPDPLVSDADRAFWAFQAPRRVAPPVPDRPSLAHNPIDAFISKALAAKGGTLAPEADPQTLLRRVSLDLTGLPPDPDQADDFLNDRAPGAYERLVDRLLASPRHGERWGRHWLDLAGYADSEGKREQDLPRPSAWRYRDYVIRALNADKPYDRFLTEQIAGDELADYEHAPEITQELEDNLVATGFLRMAPDPTWANPTNFLPDRLDVISDEVDVLGSGVLGLTLKCARCHSHKLDPIPQRDYYQLLDLFKGAFDEYDWLRSGWEPTISKGRRADRELPYVSSAERRRWKSHNDAIQRQVEALRSQRDAAKEAARERLRRARRAALPATTRDALDTANPNKAARHHPAIAFLAARFEQEIPSDPPELSALDPEFKAKWETLERAIKVVEAKILPEPTIRALWDRGEPSPTYIARRGDPFNPGPRVGPGVPSVLNDGQAPFEVKPPWPGARSTGRRLALARWLIQPDHPLTARVIVNRVWKHHFGIGLVATPGNFGKAGAPPTHPELLDWLAVEFIQQGWSLKALHRMIVTSATYRQSSAVSALSRRVDPEGRLYARFPLRRVEAEVLYDSLLLVSGRLDATPHGPPDPVKARADGLVIPEATARGWRRGVYLQQNRKNVTTILEAFDLPSMNPNCLERRDSNVPTQALHLWNDGMVRELAASFARRVRSRVGDDPGGQVDEAFRLALSRPPDALERAASLDALERLRSEWGVARSSEGTDGDAVARRQALATFCHVLVNSAAFLYID